MFGHIHRQFKSPPRNPRRQVLAGRAVAISVRALARNEQSLSVTSDLDVFAAQGRQFHFDGEFSVHGEEHVGTRGPRRLVVWTEGHGPCISEIGEISKTGLRLKTENGKVNHLPSTARLVALGSGCSLSLDRATVSPARLERGGSWLGRL